ncbi:mavicyanin-like [Solanum dulcamara]|uniref:mavicyanin-like n=1 Tax=Solanum dulcamara TaxID=45834 RepID=UPI0024869C35|nr:mavicyanin-like [Solanum dulcamara]
MATYTTAAVYEVGDSQVFNYNNKYHNVMQVSRQEYESCTITDPIATFNTGKDSITLPSSGDYYYVCGIPGHCQIGQKFHIHIVGTNSQGSVDNPSQTSVVASPLSYMWLIFIISILELCFSLRILDFGYLFPCLVAI